MPGIDAAKLAASYTFIDEGGQLFASPVHHLVPQLARFLGFAVDDPLDNEVMQRGVLIERFQKHEDAPCDPVADRRFLDIRLGVAFLQFGAGLQYRGDQKLGLVAEIIADERRIDPGRARDVQPRDASRRDRFGQIAGRRNEHFAPDCRRILVRSSLPAPRLSRLCCSSQDPLPAPA